MNRRQFIQLMSAGFMATAIDPERILWVPGSKTIFLPSKEILTVSESQIVLMEINKLLPSIKDLWERDEVFYKSINAKLWDSKHDRTPTK